MEERASYTVATPGRAELIAVELELSEAQINRVDAIARELGLTRSEAVGTMIDGFDWKVTGPQS